MSARRILSVLLAITCCGYAAEPPAGPSPWSDSFTMPLRDQVRTFATWEGAKWLVIDHQDLADPAFLDGKDITFIAKLIRTDGSKAFFYNLTAIEVTGAVDLWRTRIDGDNLYLFGRFLVAGARQRLLVMSVANAPSDQQIIAARLAQAKPEDWDGRLAVGDWVREQASLNGNREYWLASADAIGSNVVDDILAAAEAKKDGPLLLKAMTLCTDVLHDPGRAARIGSCEWVRKGPGAEEVALRMRKLNFEFIAGRWLPRAEAAAAEFESRFSSLNWNDADGYYHLGLWCDANADLLPRSRELSFRCFQAGFRADPHHNAIRRELGLEAVSEKASLGTPQGDYRDPASGIAVKSPEGWKRTDPIDGDATWIDPRSDTAYITVKLVRGDQVAGEFPLLWSTQLATLQARTGFQNLAETDVAAASGKARHLRYAYKEGRFTRLGDLVLVQNPSGRAAVRLEASYAETEQEGVRKTVLALVSSVLIPAGDASGKPAAPATVPAAATPGAGSRASAPIVPEPAPAEKPVVSDPD